MASPTNNKAPIRATWICLSLAWVCLLTGIGLLPGSLLCLVTFVLSIVVMAKGETMSGLIPMLLIIFASPVVWLIGVGLVSAFVLTGIADLNTPAP